MSTDYYLKQATWRDWEKFFETVFQDLPTKDFSDKVAIELGCGIGAATKVLAKKFQRVVAIDSDPELIEQAKRSCFGLKNVTFEVAPNLKLYDAFGERFDYLFAGYVVAYLGDVTETLQHFSMMLKPGGCMTILEIQGLFAIHSPIERRMKLWFDNFEKTRLLELGYDSLAGSRLVESCGRLSDLKKIVVFDWKDAELCFDGPLEVGSPVYRAWEDRWRRLWPVMKEFSVEEGIFEAFFGCLTNPEHVCERYAKALTVVKLSTPKQATREQGEKVDESFPSEYGGSGGDDS